MQMPQTNADYMLDPALYGASLIANMGGPVWDQETNVRAAMEEQETGSKAILDSIGNLNEITGEEKGSAAGMLGGSRDVMRESRTLEGLTAEIGNGIQEMASGAERIDMAVHTVNDISVENKKQIEQLIMEVSRFKVA